MAENYGVITEQNDLGLNFMSLNPKDQAVAENYCNKKAQDSSESVEVVAEDKKN